MIKRFTLIITLICSVFLSINAQNNDSITIKVLPHYYDQIQLIQSASNNKIIDGELHIKIHKNDVQNLVDNNIFYQVVRFEEISASTYKSAYSTYPTYSEFVSIMNQFETTYPNICKIYSIGSLSSGREILVARISDNVNVNEAEPDFLYTATMHGDELAGYPIMLHLIDSLLSSYASISEIQNLIDNCDIWIAPLSNPDGTYYGGNNTVWNSKRTNANGVDLNRNYPDFINGQNPDGNATQAETQMFIDLADSNNFIMAANFHGGAEVFNYPWDNHYTRHADDDWWVFVGTEYADTAMYYSPNGYFEFFGSGPVGVTNGYDWYSTSGSRQDYMQYYKHCREVTIEISNTKKVAENQLDLHWDYNKNALFNYLYQSQYGFQGIVRDSITHQPLKAKIEIQNHDMENSWVETCEDYGDFYRPIIAGTYTAEISSPGYISKFVTFTIANYDTVFRTIDLASITSIIENSCIENKFEIYPNPANDILFIFCDQNTEINVEIYDATANKIYSKMLYSNDKIDVSNLGKGVYIVKIIENDQLYSKKIIIE